MTVIPIVISALGTLLKGLIRRLEELEIRRRDHSDYSIIKIGQNIEKSPGDLRRFIVTPVENNQLMLL